MPLRMRLTRRPSCHIFSKAFYRSMKAARTTLLALSDLLYTSTEAGLICHFRVQVPLTASVDWSHLAELWRWNGQLAQDRSKQVWYQFKFMQYIITTMKQFSSLTKVLKRLSHISPVLAEWALGDYSRWTRRALRGHFGSTWKFLARPRVFCACIKHSGRCPELHHEAFMELALGSFEAHSANSGRAPGERYCPDLPVCARCPLRVHSVKHGVNAEIPRGTRGTLGALWLNVLHSGTPRSPLLHHWWTQAKLELLSFRTSGTLRDIFGTELTQS